MSKIDVIKKTIVDNQIDGILLSAHDNRFWFTNFDSSAGFLFINKESYVVFLVDGRYYKAASEFLKKSLVNEVVLLNNTEPLKNQITKILEQLKMFKIGLESEYVTMKEFNFYQTFTGFEFKGFDSIKMRTIKEDSEIESLQIAANIAAETINWIKKEIKEGMTEKEVANMITKHMLDLGASANSFPPIVASGINGSCPHHKPTNKIIKKGEMITVDIGCIYSGYCSDITRSFILGNQANDSEMIEIYNVVLKSQLSGIKSATNQITGSELDKVCRNVISETKYKDYFVHSTGHGVGIQVHEEPYVSSKNNDLLVNNSVVTVEPGIYVPNLGGVRIEDTIVIKDNQALVLTRKANKNLYSDE